MGIEGATEASAGRIEGGDGVVIRGEQRAHRCGQGVELVGGDGGAEGGGGDVLQRVGLVDDDDVVLGQHHPSTGQVGAVEVDVDHHDISGAGPVPCVLGETDVTVGAALGTRALAGADRQPGPVGVREGEG